MADLEHEYSLNRDLLVKYFMSWMTATEEEIKHERASCKSREMSDKNLLDVRERELRKARPELFK